MRPVIRRVALAVVCLGLSWVIGDALAPPESAWLAVGIGIVWGLADLVLVRKQKKDRSKMTKEAWAHNEWMRQYLDEPEAFKSNFQIGTEFLTAAADGTPPSYGEECEAFFNHLLTQAPESAEDRAASFNGWKPGWAAKD